MGSRITFGKGTRSIDLFEKFVYKKFATTASLNDRAVNSASLRLDDGTRLMNLVKSKRKTKYFNIVLKRRERKSFSGLH